MKASNMVSSNGNKVVNQFIIDNSIIEVSGEKYTGDLFQSYNSIIAFIGYTGVVFLDSETWNYSRTTAKYRNQFLGETTKETRAKIDSGEYKLVNLND